MTYKARLAQTRANDAAHEQMMQEAAAKACVSLSGIRAMGGKLLTPARDAAFLRMFKKARVSK